MDLQEKWTTWSGADHIEGRYERTCFTDSKDGLTITYINKKDSSKIMKVVFRSGYLGYRDTDETYMWETQRDCSFEGAFAYKVTNSSYIKWMQSISNCITDKIARETQHFVFVSSDDYLEVLADSDPEIIFEELP